MILNPQIFVSTKLLHFARLLKCRNKAAKISVTKGSFVNTASRVIVSAKFSWKLNPACGSV